MLPSDVRASWRLLDLGGRHRFASKVRGHIEEEYAGVNFALPWPCCRNCVSWVQGQNRSRKQKEQLPYPEKQAGGRVERHANEPWCWTKLPLASAQTVRLYEIAVCKIWCIHNKTAEKNKRRLILLLTLTQHYPPSRVTRYTVGKLELATHRHTEVNFTRPWIIFFFCRMLLIFTWPRKQKTTEHQPKQKMRNSTLS